MIEPNNDEVICPECCHQFRAIPVNVQHELTTEREVSDKLEKALQKLVSGYDSGIHFCASGLPLWENAIATLAEVAAIRASHTSGGRA